MELYMYSETQGIKICQDKDKTGVWLDMKVGLYFRNFRIQLKTEFHLHLVRLFALGSEEYTIQKNSNYSCLED